MALLHDLGQRRAFIGGDDQKLRLHPDGRLDLRDLPHAVLLRVHDDQPDVGLLSPKFFIAAFWAAR
jgi:hypothetical protein